jgi:hypothetical protein
MYHSCKRRYIRPDAIIGSAWLPASRRTQEEGSEKWPRQFLRLASSEKCPTSSTTAIALNEESDGQSYQIVRDATH